MLTALVHLHYIGTLRGLELIMHSTSVIHVRKVSSSSWLPAFNNSGSSALRTLRINLSQVRFFHVARVGHVHFEWYPFASIP